MAKISTDKQLIGSVSFLSGETQQFTDARAYLDCIREELPHEATTGFRFRTITQDPAVRKAVDDTEQRAAFLFVQSRRTQPFGRR